MFKTTALPKVSDEVLGGILSDLKTPTIKAVAKEPGRWQKFKEVASLIGGAFKAGWKGLEPHERYTFYGVGAGAVALGVLGGFSYGYNAAVGGIGGASLGAFWGRKGAYLGAAAGALGSAALYGIGDKIGGPAGGFVTGINTSLGASLFTAGMLRGGMLYKIQAPGVKALSAIDPSFAEVMRGFYPNIDSPRGMAINFTDFFSSMHPSVAQAASKYPRLTRYVNAAMGSPSLIELAEKSGGMENATTAGISKALMQDIYEGLPIGLGFGAIGWGAGAIFGGSKNSSTFSAKDDNYNTIEGLRHGGEAEKSRKRLTDFGSGLRRMFGGIKNFMENVKPSEVLRGWKKLSGAFDKSAARIMKSLSNPLLDSPGELGFSVAPTAGGTVVVNLAKSAFSLMPGLEDINPKKARVVARMHEASEVSHYLDFVDKERSLTSFSGRKFLLEQKILYEQEFNRRLHQFRAGTFLKIAERGFDPPKSILSPDLSVEGWREEVESIKRIIEKNKNKPQSIDRDEYLISLEERLKGRQSRLAKAEAIENMKLEMREIRSLDWLDPANYPRIDQFLDSNSPDWRPQYNFDDFLSRNPRQLDLRRLPKFFGTHYSPSVIVDELFFSAKMGKSHYDIMTKVRLQELKYLSEDSELLRGSAEIANYVSRTRKIISSFEKKWLPRFDWYKTEVSGNPANYNTLKGLSDGPASQASKKKIGTDHRSPWDPLRKFAARLGKTLPELMNDSEFTKVLQKGLQSTGGASGIEGGKLLGEGVFGKSFLMQTSLNYQGKSLDLSFVRKYNKSLAEVASDPYIKKQPSIDRDLFYIEATRGHSVEVENLKRVRGADYAPEFYSSDPLRRLIDMEFIPGQSGKERVKALGGYAREVNKVYSAGAESLQRTFAQTGAAQADLHGQNMIFHERGSNLPVIIDWGRAQTGKEGLSAALGRLEQYRKAALKKAREEEDDILTKGTRKMKMTARAKLSNRDPVALQAVMAKKAHQAKTLPAGQVNPVDLSLSNPFVR